MGVLERFYVPVERRSSTGYLAASWLVVRADGIRTETTMESFMPSARMGNHGPERELLFCPETVGKVKKY